MKQFNIMKLMTKATRELSHDIDDIGKAENLATAKAHGNRALGFIDALEMVIDEISENEDSDYIASVNALMYDWRADIYGEAAKKAIAAQADPEYICSLFELRDTFSTEAKEALKA